MTRYTPNKSEGLRRPGVVFPLVGYERRESVFISDSFVVAVAVPEAAADVFAVVVAVAVADAAADVFAVVVAVAVDVSDAAAGGFAVVVAVSVAGDGAAADAAADASGVAIAVVIAAQAGSFLMLTWGLYRAGVKIEIAGMEAVTSRTPMQSRVTSGHRVDHDKPHVQCRASPYPSRDTGSGNEGTLIPANDPPGTGREVSDATKSHSETFLHVAAVSAAVTGADAADAATDAAADAAGNVAADVAADASADAVAVAVVIAAQTRSFLVLTWELYMAGVKIGTGSHI
ncbi:hypothetical protein L211DRAFT_853527 [Terfezia boudieri ATCC MYA-4762]|uniref:Uncharacterized protein n=1 Tax=Terfezia boudieri ATCC MYA-4762 TaxID=1051890 RepID=A0A3N4LMA2_9PEZI|nr:hypothetical protein L211DRAFT_853527 [Terfezia boudieri ATCC MYA-4762]